MNAAIANWHSDLVDAGFPVAGSYAFLMRNVFPVTFGHTFLPLNVLVVPGRHHNVARAIVIMSRRDNPLMAHESAAMVVMSDIAHFDLLRDPNSINHRLRHWG